MLLGKKILLGFLCFCVGIFPMLRTLLPEVSGVVPFCVRDRFLFYRRTVVVRSD